MATVIYSGTHGAARLSDSPRRVYRVTVAKTGALALRNAAFWPFSSWSFAQAVRVAVDAGLSPVARYLGNPSVESNDSRAVFDVMAASGAAGTTVRELVALIESRSRFWRVVEIADAGDVPGFSSGGPGALDSGRDTALDAARDAARADSLFGRVGSAFAGLNDALRSLVVALVLAGLVALVLFLFVRFRGARG